jgi:hypothetical protein
MIATLKNLKNVKKRANQKKNVQKGPQGEHLGEDGKSKSS